MLIQFNFRNYKGFKYETSLDMTATSLKEHQYNLIDMGSEKILKIAAIYGANASGKSTVIEAFGFMNSFILNSFKYSTSNIDIPLKRYAFDKNSKLEPAEFEVFIKYKNDEYQYGFKIDNKKVLEEWLYKRDFRSKKTAKYKSLFERVGKQIECSTQLKDAKSLALITEDNTLFLSICSNAKIPYVKDVMEWFSNTTIVDMGDCEIEGLITRGVSSIIEDRKYQKELVRFLNAIDINIVDIKVEKINVEGEKNRYRIYSYHNIEDSSELVAIPFYEESSGTQKMFSLYSLFKNSIELGMPIFIDELDAKLHPLLMKYIISMFHSEETNENGAQLIYTAHDDFTLNKDIFRRDQIWFVEKDINSVATLYSLSEYKVGDKKVRNDASYNKDYLSGKYGAIPILNSFYISEDKKYE
ncbi:ATP-binding protein [Clostridium sp. NSJ-49]|uniref:AAA family ATPase n=1 Tax=Clostridium sp. NSJ-49 TaxID=2763034 RepID=UPI00164C380A|nr:ATP-binding protein [Clostridium sp. NSJ-49]MBC5626609.1 ATP-binding protein [Clostridium sp. NSJ-49]